MDDNDSLDRVLTDLFSAPTITIAEEDLALRQVVNRAHRRTRLHRLTAAGVALILFVTVGITIVVIGSRHTGEVKVETPARRAAPSTTSDVVVFDDTGGVLTVDPTTHVATHHPIAGWRPGDEPFDSLRVGNYFVVGWGDVHAAPFAGGTSRLLGTGVFVPATEPGAVWLTSYGQVQTPTERLVDMHGHVLLQVHAPIEPGSKYSDVAVTGVPGGLVIETAKGLDILDARTGRITRHLGKNAEVAPALGSLLAWCETCDRTLNVTNLSTRATRSIALTLNSGFLTLNNFVFSPDGTQLAIPVQPDGASPTGVTTKIITLNVSTDHVIDTIDTHARYASIAWSPDSQRIYIAATNTGSGGEMLVHDQKTGTTQDLGPAPGGGRLDTVLTHHDAELLPTPTIGTFANCEPRDSAGTYNNKLCSYRYGNETATTETNVTTSTSPVTTTPPSSQARFPVATTARCTPKQLSATFGFLNNAQVGLGGLILTNHGPSPCTLSGSPDVRVIDSHGKDLMVPESHGMAGNTPQPAPKGPITVAAVGGQPRGGIPMDWGNWCRPSPGPLTLHVRFAGWATFLIATPTDNADAPPPCMDKSRGTDLRVYVVFENDNTGFHGP